MRRILIATSVSTLVVLLGSASLSVAANPDCVAAGSPNCVAKPRCNCPSCDAPCRPGEPRTPKPGPPTPTTPKEAPPQPELVETGVYVAPPRTGTMQGPTSRLGIEGLSVTLPSLKLTTPRIEFPHLFRSRSEARMVIDEAHAPYVATGYQYAQPHALANRQGPPTDNCEEQLRAMTEKYNQLERQAAQLERALEQQQRTTPRDGGSRGGKDNCVTPPQPEVDTSRLDLRPLPMVRTAPVELGAAQVYPHRPVGYLQEPRLLDRTNAMTSAPATSPASGTVRRLPAVR